MKKFSVLFVIFIQGCGIYECIDMKFERQVKPIDKLFNVVLEFQGRNMSMNVQCEEYYDAMCAERGNYWSVREVGSESIYQTSKFQFFDEKLGEVEIFIPNCRDMTNDKMPPLKYIALEINGERYFLRSSEGTTRTHSTFKYMDKESKTVTLNWSLKVNNVILK